jgi:hypothetical protein
VLVLLFLLRLRLRLRLEDLGATVRTVGRAEVAYGSASRDAPVLERVLADGPMYNAPPGSCEDC